MNQYGKHQARSLVILLATLEGWPQGLNYLLLKLSFIKTRIVKTIGQDSFPSHGETIKHFLQFPNILQELLLRAEIF